MKRMFFPVAVLLSIAVTARGQSAAQKYIEQLKTTDELKEAVWGISAVKAGGGSVAEYNSRIRMMPASNAKVFTTGLALNELGSGYRFRTRLAYSGSIEDGVLKGDLYIVGGRIMLMDFIHLINPKLERKIIWFVVILQTK